MTKSSLMSRPNQSQSHNSPQLALLSRSTSNSKTFIHSHTSPRLKSGGLFGSSFMEYSVKTEPLGWQVKRRFSDFETLRGVMRKLYPHIYVIHVMLRSLPFRPRKQKADSRSLSSTRDAIFSNAFSTVSSVVL